MRLNERFFGISKTITRSLLGKPATLMYPQRPRAYSAATRGMVKNEIEKCIFCRLCERNCPTAAIVVSKERKEWQIDSLKCCTCRRCVEVCPVKCLTMHNVYFPSVTDRPSGLYLMVQPPKPPAASPTSPPKEQDAASSEESKGGSEKEKEEQG
ncbi:MAG TPA: 4Fe-4S binding protein [Syntrophales bacterium]|nr:4Fe-4S binding protein [Syntrophales bacterium]